MTAARVRPAIRSKIVIPLFAEKPSHPFVPLGHRTAGAHSEGQGRPSAGACALPLTAASTLAGWCRSGDRTAWHYVVLLLAGALSVCIGPGVAVAQSASVERPAAAHPYAAHIIEASQRFGIPEHWIRAVLRAESAGDVRAISSAGAMGLMQVVPDTWAGLRVRHGLGRDPYDPRDNILAGTANLREMFDRYGNVGAMLAAYNAGPGRYDEHRATGRPLPAETRAYVAALAPILGLRERASELASLELGPVTEIEHTRKLSDEIDQDRFTRIDRALAEEADARFLDLRHEPAEPRRQFERTLRLRRLTKLDKMGLATEHAPAVWELSKDMEPALRELGERGDIIRTMQKALGPQGDERDPMSFQIHDKAPETPIVGRVVDKHLFDELGENLTIVVDGIDGRTHYIAGIPPERLEDARIGSIIEFGPAEATARPSDRIITAIAEDGIYRPSRHLERAKFEGRVPGGDYEGYVDAHVRRLEALRRAGIVERIDANQWSIPDDLVSRAAVYDAGRDRQASVRVLSPVDLQRQIGSDGATWLDRRLVHGETADLASVGFGQQVREAMDQRREHHVERGDATRSREGRIFCRRNLLATLREREVARVGAEMAESKGLPFRAAADGESVSGKFTGTVQLSSGKFAVVEKSYEFTLVPWRPVIDRQLSREVMGVVQGGSVSWQLGRQRGISL